LELKGQLPHGLESVASYSFQEAKDREPRQFLNNSPRHLGKLDLVQPLLPKKALCQLDAKYRSGMTTFTSGSFHRSQLSILISSVRESGSISISRLSLYNILDKTYYDPPSTGVPEGAQQDGVLFRVNMTWHLGER